MEIWYIFTLTFIFLQRTNQIAYENMTLKVPGHRPKLENWPKQVLYDRRKNDNTVEYSAMNHTRLKSLNLFQ